MHMFEEYVPSGFASGIFTDRYAIHEQETFREGCLRVASHIAAAEEGIKREEYSKRFFDIMVTNRFSPGGRIWRGAGRARGYLLNCFVLSDDIDSREGWGETLKHVTIISGVGGGVGINFSRVRPRGTKIHGTGGEATGAVSLMRAINGVCEELRAGGGRRSALMFCLRYDHPDLVEFLTCKLDKGQLNNANISVCVDQKFFDLIEADGEIVMSWNGEERDRVKAKDVWQKIVDNSWKCGDPGVLNMGFANHMNTIFYISDIVATNPCLRLSSKLLTKNGIRTLSEVSVGEDIWSKTGWTKVVKKWQTGTKPVYRARTNASVFYGTANHRVVSGGNKIELENADTMDSLIGPQSDIRIHHRYVMDGLVIGDGTYHKASKTIYLNIGLKDGDYHRSDGGICDLIRGQCNWREYYYTVETSIDANELPNLPERKIPDRFLFGDKDVVASFMRGLFSANGSVCDTRITLKTSSELLAEQAQIMLSSLGIRSYITTNEPTKVKFENGIYTCRRSYDLNITHDKQRFIECIGFIQRYKQEKAKEVAFMTSNKPAKVCYDIVSMKMVGDEEVWDITVDNDSHTFWCDGTNVSNCGEIGLIPFDCCDLGSLNLSTHVVNGKIHWESLAESVTLGVRFLDDVIDVNKFPIAQIEETCRKLRRIGLGVMGVHDMLLKLGVRYGSDQAIAILDEVMGFIKKKAYEASIFLAVEKGSFPGFKKDQHLKSGFFKTSLTKSVVEKVKEYGIRNAALLTVAPTGTTAIVAGVSSGIEPMFAPVHKRKYNKHTDKVREGQEEIVVHPLLAQFIRDGKDIGHFEGAHEITPEQHCRVQAVCQKHVDNSISKTINVPNDCDPKLISDIMLKYLPSLKGVTIYRDGSKGESPMTPLPVDVAKQHIDSLTQESSVKDCPKGVCTI